MIDFLIEHDKKIYDFSSVVSKLDVDFKLNDGCGKLQFEYIPAGIEVSCGDVAYFRKDDIGIFYGKVFKVSGGKNGSGSVTVYDQLRYGKTKDTIVVNGDTADSLVRRMSNYLGLNLGMIEKTGYILATDVQYQKTWIDIIYGAISDTLLSTKKKYRLADEFGAITFRNMESLQLNLILGDDSLCYDYDYSKSIDDEFYNQIKLFRDNEIRGKETFIVERDDKSIEKYGMLQYFEVLDKDANVAQARNKAKSLLQLYNSEVQTLKLSCLGDDRIREGVSFYGSIADINLNRRLLVKSVKHSYLPVHTMDVEVYVQQY